MEGKEENQVKRVVSLDGRFLNGLLFASCPLERWILLCFMEGGIVDGDSGTLTDYKDESLYQ